MSIRRLPLSGRKIKIGTIPAGASVYIDGSAPADVSALRVACTRCGEEVRAGEEPALLGVHKGCQPGARHIAVLD